MLEGRFAAAETLLPAGGRSALLLAALDDARLWLEATFGSADPSAYSLAKLHAAEFPSAFGQRLEVGRFAVGGSVDTVNVAPAPFFDGKGEPLERFASTEMALYRMAVQFADDGVPEATFDLGLGSHEDPDSPFFSNLQDDWVEAKHRPLLFRPGEVAAATVDEQVLAAAP